MQCYDTCNKQVKDGYMPITLSSPPWPQMHIFLFCTKSSRILPRQK